MADQRHFCIRELEQLKISELDLTTVDDYLLHIVDEGTLGAGNHIELIQKLFKYLCKELQPENLWAVISTIQDFIASTRGEEAPIITNTMHWLLRDLQEESAENFKHALEDRIESWSREARSRKERLVEWGVEKLRHQSSILLFDYSSTVEAIVDGLCQKLNKPPQFVVFESRVLDGGWPYVRYFMNQNLPIRYVPDSAMYFECTTADALLLGAENLWCNGSILNTLGSNAIAAIAQQQGLSVYGCCDLFKLDLRTYKGVYQQPSIKNYGHLLLDNNQKGRDQFQNLKTRIDTNVPEIEIVPPNLLNGIITDQGVVSPDSIHQLGQSYFPEIKKESIDE